MNDAEVKLLSEHVKRPVKEEQSEMFPKDKASSPDMDKQGVRLAARKDEQLTQHA